MIKFMLAELKDCYKLSKLKKEVWCSTYRGIYSNEDLDNYDYKYHEDKFAKKISSGEQVYLIINEEKLMNVYNVMKNREKIKSKIITN